MNRKIKLVAAVVAVLVITIAVLLNNKSRMQAKSRPDEIKFFPVTLVQVAPQKLSEDLSLTGTIVANNDVAILSETQGKVVKVLAGIGDHVEAGSVIVQVDDELKQAAFATAEVNYQKAKRDLERYEAVYKDGSVSDAQLEGSRLTFKAAEAQYIVARRQYNDTKIKSPISGVLTARPVDVGTMINTNNLVAEVVDISRLKVKLNVAESDVFKLKVGNKVEVSTDVYPGVTFTGHISTISAKGDEAHTYPVEILLANDSRNPLKAGMFGRVSFVSITPTRSLSIPRQALVGSVKQAQVFVVQNGVARLRDIVVGGEFDTNLEVLSGLHDGDRVVLSGQNNLKDGVTVSVVK